MEFKKTDVKDKKEREMRERKNSRNFEKEAAQMCNVQIKFRDSCDYTTSPTPTTEFCA